MGGDGWMDGRTDVDGGPTKIQNNANRQRHEEAITPPTTPPQSSCGRAAQDAAGRSGPLRHLSHDNDDGGGGGDGDDAPLRHTMRKWSNSLEEWSERCYWAGFPEVADGVTPFKENGEKSYEITRPPTYLCGQCVARSL